ncbi:MAG: 3-isopropylmalate dehydratase large subunit, partial [Kiloniellales bacterium]
MAAGSTLLDKVWDLHVVARLGGDYDLLHVDRHLIHDLSGTHALKRLAELGRPVRNPALNFATPDHTVSTAPSGDADGPFAARCVVPLRELSREHGIRLFDVHEPGHGIVHIMGPELGLTLPGVTLVCGDSHTCTHGALGALAWGIGLSEVSHVLATQTVIQRKPKRLRVTVDGRLRPGVTAKDLILCLIGREGAAAGDGFAVEYAGPAIRALTVEARMTVCNLSIEMGAKVGMVAPDEATLDYVAGRRFAPEGALWDLAVAHWRQLPSDDGAEFDREIGVDADAVAPQVTWGTSPEHVIAVNERVPDPAREPDPGRRQAMVAALDYVGLAPGMAIEGLEVEHVFIGSCTNSRLSDLRAAARVIQGRKVAEGVRAWVVPGSRQVKLEAEAEGLDTTFRAAGFEWREPGCSMCVA